MPLDFASYFEFLFRIRVLLITMVGYQTSFFGFVFNGTDDRLLREMNMQHRNIDIPIFNIGD